MPSAVKITATTANDQTGFHKVTSDRLVLNINLSNLIKPNVTAFASYQVNQTHNNTLKLNINSQFPVIKALLNFPNSLCENLPKNGLNTSINHTDMVIHMLHGDDNDVELETGELKQKENTATML